MFDDFRRLQLSVVLHQTHLVVKRVALKPDEFIEEEDEVTKSIKRHYEQVKSSRATLVGPDQTKDLGEDYYKKKSKRVIHSFMDNSERLASFRVSYIRVQ